MAELGVYRWMVVSSRRLILNFESGLSEHFKAIYKKYADAKKPMPIAIVLGGAPAVLLAAASKAKAGISEAQVAGGFNLDPIALIKAEKSELMVPTHAEIVIEGEILPGDMGKEGPFGSIGGYTKPCMQPAMTVTAITHRKDPIFPFIVDGSKPSDTQVIVSILESARLTKIVTQQYMYPLVWCSIPVDFGLGLCIASYRNVFYGCAGQISRLIFSKTNLFDKILLVDGDVEPGFANMCLKDWMTKANPAERDRTVVLQGYPPTVFNRYVTEEEMRKIGAGRVFIDTAWPAHWEKDEKPIATALETVYPKDVVDKVVANWKEYGFDTEPKVKYGMR